MESFLSLQLTVSWEAQRRGCNVQEAEILVTPINLKEVWLTFPQPIFGDISEAPSNNHTKINSLLYLRPTFIRTKTFSSI